MVESKGLDMEKVAWVDLINGNDNLYAGNDNKIRKRSMAVLLILVLAKMELT